MYVIGSSGETSDAEFYLHEMKLMARGREPDIVFRLEKQVIRSAALHKPEYTEHENTPSSLDRAGRSNIESRGKRRNIAPVFFELQTQM